MRSLEGGKHDALLTVHSVLRIVQLPSRALAGRIRCFNDRPRTDTGCFGFKAQVPSRFPSKPPRHRKPPNHTDPLTAYARVEILVVTALVVIYPRIPKLPHAIGFLEPGGVKGCLVFLRVVAVVRRQLRAERGALGAGEHQLPVVDLYVSPQFALLKTASAIRQTPARRSTGPAAPDQSRYSV